MSDKFKLSQDPVNDSDPQIQKLLEEAQASVGVGVKKALKKFKKTTDELREKSLSSKGSIVNMSNTSLAAQNSLESILNKSATDLDYNEYAMKAIMSQIGIFITNTKKADVKRVKSESNKLKNWLRQLKLVGAKQDENYTDFIKVLRGTGSVKGLVSNSQKRAIKERVLKEEDSRLIFDETFLKENTSTSELVAKSIELVKSELQAFVDVLSKTEEEEDRASLAKDSIGLSLDNLVKEKGTIKEFTFIVVYYYTKNIAGTRKKNKKNMRVSQTTFSKDTVKFKSRYAIFKVECRKQDLSKSFISTTEGELDNIEFSTAIDNKSSFDTGSQNAKKVWSSKVSGTIYNPLISKLVKDTLEDKPIFQFGHVISLAQKQMDVVVETLRDLEVPEELKETNFYKNFTILKANIQVIAKVAKNVDSIFSNWVDSDELITGVDIVEFIENNTIEADVNFLTKVNNKVTRSGEIKSIKQTIEIGTNVRAKASGQLEGIMEPDKVNNVKAILLKRLKNLMIKQLEQFLSGDLLEELAEKQVLALVIKKRSDSPLDALIKSIFPGIKIKRGKRTSTSRPEKVNISTMKAKPFRLKQKTSVIQPTRIKEKPGKEKVTGSRTIRTDSDSPSAKKVKNDINLIGAVNAEVGEEVKKLMVSPRLVYRTGRFASSVKIITLTGKEVTFVYQRNPYSVFDKDEARRPYDIISEAITNILRRYDRSYAATAEIREG